MIFRANLRSVPGRRGDDVEEGVERRPFGQGCSQLGDVGQVPVPFEHFGGVLTLADGNEVVWADAAGVPAGVVDGLGADVTVDEPGDGAVDGAVAASRVAVLADVSLPVPAVRRRVDLDFMADAGDGRQVDSATTLDCRGDRSRPASSFGSSPARRRAVGTWASDGSGDGRDDAVAASTCAGAWLVSRVAH